jgi:hypothetical protein
MMTEKKDEASADTETPDESTSSDRCAAQTRAGQQCKNKAQKDGLCAVHYALRDIRQQARDPAPQPAEAPSDSSEQPSRVRGIALKAGKVGFGVASAIVTFKELGDIIVALFSASRLYEKEMGGFRNIEKRLKESNPDVLALADDFDVWFESLRAHAQEDANDWVGRRMHGWKNTESS